MKFGFVTCVQLGLSCIEAIYDVGGSLDLVVTLNDEQAVNKSGRVYLDNFCEDHNIRLHKSSHINNKDCVDLMKELEIDWLFIIGWSQIAGENVLNAPAKGVLGIHPTMLPEGRGRAAIPWALLKGLTRTGVTMFKLDEGVDTGDILGQVEIPIKEGCTASELYSDVNREHVELIKQIFPELVSNTATFKKQDHSKATNWPGRKPEDGEISLEGSVYDAEKLIRAVGKPYPGAFYYKDGKKVIVWSAQVVGNNEENTLVFQDGYLKILEQEIIR